MAKRILFYGALLCAFVLTACSLQKKADQMADTSNEIKDVSKHMSKTTDDVDQISKHLSQTTDYVYSDLTYQESYDMFLKNMRLLYGEEPTTPAEASLNPQSDMLLYAGAGIESLYFQCWESSFELSELDARFKLGIEMLFVKALQHIPRDFTVDILKPDRSYEAIASLGVKLDRLRATYATSLQQRGLPEISLYSVLMTALADRNQIARTEQFPQATTMALQYPREITYMMQLRHNYFPLMVVARMTNLQDLGTVGLLGMRQGLSSSDAVNFDKLNPSSEELKEWTLWLNQAMETRASLRKMGIAPQYNRSFADIVANVDFGQTQILAMPLAQQTDMQKLRYAFAQAYMAVVNDSSPVKK
jgi:hypothetical protein